MKTIKEKIATRKSQRSSVRIFVTVRVMHQAVRARVVNLSVHGMALDLEAPIQAIPGQTVTIESEQLGNLIGDVRWYHNSRLGLEYKVNTNAFAQISAYFRFFHKEVRPVLRG